MELYNLDKVRVAVPLLEEWKRAAATSDSRPAPDEELGRIGARIDTIGLTRDEFKAADRIAQDRIDVPELFERV